MQRFMIRIPTRLIPRPATLRIPDPGLVRDLKLDLQWHMLGSSGRGLRVRAASASARIC